MPLAEPNRLSVPSKIPLFRGRKPTCIRDITRQTANTNDSDNFLALSGPQKSTLVDLALYRFGEAQAGKRHNPEKAVHSVFLAKSSTRRELGDFTNAMIEGMLIVKEMEEDKLYAYVEFDLDRINLKDTRQQSDIDMMKTIQLHASPFLLSIPGVAKSFARLERSLAKILVPYMNDIGKRRNYSSDHLVMLKSLIIDPEIADKDDDDFDEDIQHTPRGPTHKTTPLLLALETATTATPTSVSSVRTMSGSSAANVVLEGYRWPDDEREAVFEEEIFTAAPSRQSTEYSPQYVSIGDSLATTFWDAEGEGESVIGTFTPLRHPHPAHSRSSPAQMSTTPARPSTERVIQSPVRPSSARSPATYRLVRVEELPHGAAAASAAATPYLPCSSNRERHRPGRQTSQSQLDSNASPTTRIRQFRPFRQADHPSR